jgi:tetratricopeptide (TPR) repeat protein
MDVHQTGTRADRDLYTYASIRREAWDELARRHGVELAMVDGHQEWILGDHLLDFLDLEPDWALVFRDDAAALYLRRSSPQGPAADSLAYRVMPGGNEALVALWPRIVRNPALRDSLKAELERCAASSRFNAHAHSSLANLAFMEKDRAGARRHLLAALRADPAFFTVHRRLGYLLMGEGRWREAIREFERECAINRTRLDEYARMAEAWEKLGEPHRAVQLYRRELDLHPGNEAARHALARLSGIGP